MNGGFQIDGVEDIFKLILVIVIVIPFLGAMFSLINSLNQDCPQCEDCTPYKQNLSNISEQLKICKNQSVEIVYVNQTIEVETEIPELIGSPPVTYMIIEISLLLALVFSITLFKFKLPEKIKQIVKKYDKIIKWFKIGSVVVSALIFIRLIWILIKMF